jgi:spermidine/putrescine transport system substrate-binding protein
MKKLLFVTFFILLTLSLSACGSKEEVVTINVFNWGDYIGEETIEKFTQASGIKVNYDVFDSNEAMYTKLKSGAVDYDVLVPSDYMIEKLIKEDMLMPLQYDNIENALNIDDNFKNLAYDADNLYSIPYMWGTLGIIYNTTMVNEPIDSWNILWDQTYENQIIMKNSVRDSFAPALKLLGDSINSEDKIQWEAALALLQEQKAIVQGYAADEARDKMIGEEAAIALMYSGEALLCIEENENLQYVVPKEGSNLWFDAMCIPTTSKQQAAAEAFINFMCDVNIAYENADYIGYSTPISASKALLDEDIQKDPAAYPDQSILDKCEVFVDLGKDMTEYTNDLWNQLLAY